MRIQEPVNGANRWKLEYLQGDLLRRGFNPIYASVPPFASAARIYCINEENELVKTCFDTGKMEKFFETKFTGVPMPPAFLPKKIIANYLTNLVFIGIPIYVLSRSVAAAMAISAIPTSAILSGERILFFQEYQSDLAAWHEYKKFMEEAGREMPYRPLE